LSTDTSAGRGDGPPAEAPDDDLTFAVHDLGRERATEEEPADLGFAPVARADASPPAAGEDGFVIHQPQSVAPAAPVDALVVGAPEPVSPAEAPATAALTGFMIDSASVAPAASATAQELWTTREPAPEPAATPTPTSRRGWSTRHSELVDRSAHATMLRLREEAVNVSWKAAWIAVTSAEPRLLRKRGSSPS
jgi:hypothetical protein